MQPFHALSTERITTKAERLAKQFMPQTIYAASPDFEQTCLRPRGWQLINLMLTQDDIKNALAAVKYPGYSRDIVSFGLVKEISAANGAISVTIQLTSPNPEAALQIKTECERVLKVLPGVNHVHVEVRQPAGWISFSRCQIHLRSKTKFPA